MIKRSATWLKNSFYAFPIQLVLLQLRSHLLLIGIWAVPALIISGALGRKLGLWLLFLDPEYLGRVGFWSFFFIGLTLGGFVMTWNLTSYLLSAHFFPFLASLSRPFTKFCFNNLLIPLGFFAYYAASIIHFEYVMESLPPGVIAVNLMGLLTGLFVLFLLNGGYFYFTNSDIFSFVQKGLIPAEMVRQVPPGRRDVDVDYIKQDEHRIPVRTYLTETLMPRRVRSVEHYDSAILMRIFRQNHLNALLVQLLSMLALMGLGLLVEMPWSRIPAGASIFIMASIATALLGAIIYWFSSWWVTALIVVLVLVDFITGFDWLRAKNKAYGMNYETTPAAYSYPDLVALASPEQVEIDKQQTIAILENWRKRAKRPGTQAPKMVILCVSGGGLRSATWTMHAVQQADSILGGSLLNHTVLVTGASGGMIGMAYLRELYLLQQQGEALNYRSSVYTDHVAKDLLNAVAFTTVSNDLFVPRSRFYLDGKRYRKDRGYIFEQQLNENTGRLLDKKMADYRDPERRALVPMMYITPTVVNDGRRMIISPQGVSFMMNSPIGIRQPDAVEIDAVDFGRLFARQDADDLRFLTALRMNASYPYVLPTVHLPTRPGIELMDAGFRDNYGLLSAARFIQVFHEWIQEHTSGVVLVQINTSEKIETISPSDQKGVITSLFNPLDIAGQLLSLQEFEQDAGIGFVFDLLGEERFQVVRFLYRPTKASKVAAAISFHLSQGEKRSVLQAWDLPENQASVKALRKALQ
ncbi:MAG: patatin-like phospholipase family protein [Saprospiraceae bacterium]|nr:patatin-like phospholipase family protein [Saprospiraceae bacterium]